MQETKQKRRGHLRDTFILFFIVISCVPILLLGILSLLNIVDSYKRNISERENQLLVNAGDQTRAFFSPIIDTLSINFDSLESTTTAQTSTWKMYAEKILDGNKAILEISFVDPQGKEVVKKSRVDSTPTLLYVSELPLFKNAKKGEIGISDIHRTIKNQTVTIAVPSIINGVVVNVVIAEIDITQLAISLDKMRLGNTGYVLLFDRQGNLVGGKHAGDPVLDIDFSKWDKIIRTLKGETFNALSGEDRYVSLVSDVPIVSSATSTVLVSRISWPLFVEWPIKESDAVIESFRNKIIGTLFFSIILVLIVATFLANKLVYPIRQLEEAANEIEKGNFDKKVEIVTNNELEELGESFNTMSVGLKRLEELKNEFVYVAAHELRAPVTAIKGYMELIFDGSGGPLTPEMEHFLTPVKNSNLRLVNLVNDLLKVARSEAGKLEIAVFPTDIRKEIYAILDEIRPLAQKRNITVTYSPPENLPFVNVNTGSFKEVIMNFVSNSIKYGNDNGILQINHEINDNFVLTSIADNGRGISHEDQQHLFEKFFRAGDVKKTEIEGTGLGLFITKELIEKMGGTISVTSELGKGTTFTVSFKKTELYPNRKFP